MIDTAKLFDSVASLTLAVLLAGIAGGSQTGRPFDLSPGASAIARLSGINPAAVSTEPVGDVARRAGANLVEGVTEGVAKAADPLSQCKEGSQEPGEPITPQQAQTAKGLNLRDLTDVQAALGQPHCNEQTRWGYAIAGGGMLWAVETSEGVKIQ